MNLLMSYIHYPISVGRLFKKAFRELGHNVFAVGPCHYGFLPWSPDKDFTHHQDVPDLELFPSAPHSYPIKEAVGLCPFHPELIVMVDASFHLEGGYREATVALVASDPHCLDYTKQSETVNAFFVMQHYYMEKYMDRAGKVGGGAVPLWLPFAYDPSIHYWIPGVEKRYDLCFIGVLDPVRLALLAQLGAQGISIYQGQGILFEEATPFYNESRIAFNLSTRKDLPMRFWEGMAYRCCVVTNRVPDLQRLEAMGCYEGTHYLAYHDKHDCDVVIKRILADPERLQQIADAGYLWVQSHSYQSRAQQIIRDSVGEETC